MSLNSTLIITFGMETDFKVISSGCCDTGVYTLYIKDNELPKCEPVIYFKSLGLCASG